MTDEGAKLIADAIDRLAETIRETRYASPESFPRETYGRTWCSPIVSSFRLGNVSTKEFK